MKKQYKKNNPPQIKSRKKMRLNLFIAQYAPYSRRQADQLIQNKKVKVNGRVVSQMPVYVNPHKDAVKVNNRRIHPKEDRWTYIIFHKPSKTLTTASDPKGRRTVFHYFPKIKQRLFSVGRLDWNTEGLLILTNDGEFSKKIQNPKSKIPKTYMVKLNSPAASARLQKLKTGVTIPGGRVKAVHVQTKPKSWVRISIMEGKNKQLHFMFGKLGLKIKKLKRISIGRLKLGRLKPGGSRFFKPLDFKKVKQNPFQKNNRKFK